MYIDSLMTIELNINMCRILSWPTRFTSVNREIPYVRVKLWLVSMNVGVSIDTVYFLHWVWTVSSDMPIKTIDTYQSSFLFICFFPFMSSRLPMHLFYSFAIRWLAANLNSPLSIIALKFYLPKVWHWFLYRIFVFFIFCVCVLNFSCRSMIKS